MKLVLSLLILLLAAYPAFAEPKIPEKLIFSLSWTGIPVGVATQEIVDEGEVRKIFSTAVTLPTFTFVCALTGILLESSLSQI